MSRRLNILVAPDKFRGSLTAARACDHIRAGVAKACPDARITTIPLGDGGEGTVDLFVNAGAIAGYKTVSGPLGKPVRARYAFFPKEKTFIIEMAEASGLQLLSPEEYNPLAADTYGTGELLLHAVKKGARRIILGIGGSATNDGGTGMLRALGWRFLDKSGSEIILPLNLGKLHKTDNSKATGLSGVEIIALCDVDNPLTGKNGATRVFGPQKGLKDTAQMEKALRQLAKIVKKEFHIDLNRIPGSGAGGGIAGATALVGGKLSPAIHVISQYLDLERIISKTDLVITGEGKIDKQTAGGKLPAAIFQMAQKYKTPVIALAGCISPDAPELDGLYPLAPCPVGAEESLRNAGRYLEIAAARMTMIFLSGFRSGGRQRLRN